ncbi:MAG: carbon starvation protein A, partial [Firmicutes bacterium]|nr:carbon starvation protein A [Bacillota bacterium]
MITFILCIIILIVGYVFYGGLVEKIFVPDERKTPAIEINDGVDCVPMKTWRAFLVQLLNIAGPGPIFGALMGAVFGPVAFLWIIFGSVLGGAVHDYMSGMVSVRNGGKSIAELSGIYLGNAAKYIMRVVSMILLILSGAVLVTSPASLLAELTPNVLDSTFWTVVILVYYVLATLLPIDKVIGRLYPIFGVIIILMAVGIIGGILFSDSYMMPELQLENLNPNGLSVWPYMFITIACGAISGFHATQSPMVAKCITSEKVGKKIFYGAMLAESVIALVWVAAGIAFYGTTNGLNDALVEFGQSSVVYNISTSLLGTIGGILAVVGVVACP